MILNVRLKEKLGGLVESYSDLGFQIFGPFGKGLVDFSLASSQIGFCIAYILFVGN